MSDESSSKSRPSIPRRSGVVVPNAPKWHQKLLANLIWLLVSVVAATMRFRLYDPHGHFQRKGAGPSIFCIWHNRVVLCVTLFEKFARNPRSSPGLAGLVSASKDGALLAAIFQRFKVQPIRGSSSRRGAQALLELSTWGERGYDLAITPDGPRGPRYKVADGAIILAQITGLPLVPAAYHLNWKITLKTWDRMQIPLPFARCDLYVDEVIHVPRELSETEREAFRLRLETRLLSITKD